MEIPAYYMRGGTSKGVFFLADDLPSDPAERDAVLLRVTGSPDPCGRHADGMGGAGAGMVVLVRASQRPDCDVDYLLGTVATGEPRIDWSGNCADLSAAVGPFAIWRGFVPARDSVTTVRIRQQDSGQVLLAHVPCRNGHPLEDGDFGEEGVPFPAAEIVLDYLAPAIAPPPLCPTGKVVDRLDVPGVGAIEATLVAAGHPTVFVLAAAAGLVGTELPERINGDALLLARLEAIRAQGAVAMGLAPDAHDPPSVPAIALAAPRAGYRCSAGAWIEAERIDVLARILSTGRACHGLSVTAGIALAVAASLPGSVVQRAAVHSGGRTRIGHASGTLSVGAVTALRDGAWVMERAVISRSARRLMSGLAHVPERC